MSGTSVDDFFSRQAQEARGPEPGHPAKRRTKRVKLVRRIAIASTAVVVVGAGAVVGGGYLTVNHLVSGVQRIHGIAALDAADQPVMPAATHKSMTVRLTSAPTRPSEVGGGGVDGSSPRPEALSGLISLVHLNANNHGGGLVSIPADTVVDVPGHGRIELWSTLAIGGPSLLIKTVEHLTNVRISHYSVLDFAGAVKVVGALHGVNVDIPTPLTSQGHSFPAGINHLTAADVLAYVRQADVSEVGRAELQQNLIRAMLDKIAHGRLLAHVSSDFSLLRAITGALSVDSDFSNSQLESFALRFGRLPASAGTFITAPTSLTSGTGPVFLNKAISRALWRAIRNDSLAAFARRYPQTVTPGAPA
jgi:LCP family protein required for cell wall assembly